jgi:hypothetical protein
MVTDRLTDDLPHPVVPFLTQESSAQAYTAADRRVPLSEFGVAEFDGQNRQAQPRERFFEARHNGTDGHAVILPFNYAPHGESRGAQNQHGQEGLTPIAAETRAASLRSRAKTGRAKAKKKRGANGNKPPRVGVNIEWVQKGVGWDCREIYHVGKQRRRRHLGHIGKQKWEEMQAQNQGQALEEVLREWIEVRRAEKNMSLKSE